MKLILLTLLTFVISVETSYSQTFEWEENRKLKWADFKSQPISKDFAAASCIQISYETVKVSIWNGRGKYSVKCIFDPDSSYYHPDNVDSLLLRHEQLHFDIAEFYRRKIQNRLDSLRPFPNNVDKIFTALYSEYFDLQNKYDRETNHGTKELEQERWEKIIYLELNK